MAHKLIIAIIAFLVVQVALAGNGVPQLVPFQGRLTDPSGVPINYAVTVKYRVYPPSGSCYLYEDSQSVTPNSFGIFSVLIGASGNSTGPANSFADIFSNSSTGIANSCSSVYVPVANDWRRIEVLVDGVPFTDMQTVGAAPFSFNSNMLEGKRSADFIMKDATVTQTSLTSLLNGSDASSLHNHDSLYAKIDGSNSYTGNISTTGSLGVGTTSATADVDIQKNSPRLRLGAATGLGGTSSIEFYSGTTTQRARIETTENSNGLKFYTGSTEAMSIDANKNLYVGGSLKVTGTVGLGSYTSAQDTTLVGQLSVLGISATGSMWIESTSGTLRYWDGASAKTLMAQGSVVETVTAGTGLSSAGSAQNPTLSVSYGSTAGTAIQGNASFGGDVSGTYTNLTVDKIKGRLIDETGIVANKILKYDGTKWVIADDAAGWTAADASYAAKGIVQFDTNAATSGMTVSGGVASVNVGTGANQIIKLDGTSKLPAVDASQLANLNASNLSSGTLPVGRLPSFGGDVTSSAGSNSITLNTVSISKGGTGQTTQTAAFDALSPLTTKGDVIVHNGSNNIRLGVGSDGKALIADSAQASGVKWGDIFATDILSLATTGIVQRNGAGSYSSVTVNGPLTYSAGALGVSVGTAAGTLAAGDDSRITGALQKSGGTMSGDIDMGSQDFTDVGNIAMVANKTLGLSSHAADPGSPAVGQLWYNSSTNTIKYYDGVSVKALGVSGAGMQSFNGLTDNAQSFVVNSSGTDVGLNSASGTHTLSIPSASASNRGVLTSADWTTFNNKLGTATSFSGDVSGNYNSTSVDKIKGTAVSASAPTSGQFLVYDGTTNYAPISISGDATMSNAGVLTLANSGVTAGTYSKLTVDAKGRVTVGANIASSDVTTALGYTPLNKAGDTLGGALGLNSVTSDPAGLAGADQGKVWYRSDLSQIRYWNGSAAVTLGVSGAGMQSLNGLSDNNQSFALGTAGSAPGWTSASGTHTLDIPMASAAGTTAGLISKTDYDSFAGKQAAGSYITALTGDITAAGPGSAAATIANNAVTTGKISDGTILGADLNFTGVNTATSGIAVMDSTGKFFNFACGTNGHIATWTVSGWACQAPTPLLPTLNDGKIWIGDSSNAAVAQTMSGDATISNAGALTLANSGVTAGTYSKVTVDAKGRVTVGANIASSDVTTALGFTPLNKAGDVMAGLLGLNGVTSDPAGLVAGDEGKVWYRTDTNEIKYWNGSAAITLGAAGSGLQSFNGLTDNAQSFVVNSSGTDVAINSATGTHTLSIPSASASNRGVLTSADWTTFNNKLGTATSFSGDVSGNYNSTSVDKIKGTAVSASAPTSGQFLVYNGTTQYAPISISGDATMSNAGALTLANSGVTAGTYSKVTVDAKGRVTVGADIASSDVTTALGYTPLNKAGDAMTGALKMNAQNEVRFADSDSSNYVGFRGPATVTADKIWTLPAVDGSTGQVLTTDGVGVLSWSTPAPAGITSLGGESGAAQSLDVGTSGTAPNWVSASDMHTINIPMASTAGTTAGLISKTDYDSFAGKQAAGSYITALTGDITAAGPGSAAATIANNAVTTGKISDGTILGADLNFTGVNTATSGIAVMDSTGKFFNFACGTNGHIATWTVSGWACQAPTPLLPTLNDGKIWVGDSSNAAVAQTMSGDATLSNTGALTLANSGVTAGTYSKVTVDAKGRVTVGANIASSDVTTALGFTPLNKAGDVMSGLLGLNGVTSDPAGLVAGDEGKVWYRTDTNEIKYWNGSAAITLGAAGSGLQSFNGLTDNSQTFVVNSTGTDVAINSATGTHTLSIPSASASNRGVLTSADWTTFNNKLGTATSFSGDVSGNYNSTSVDKIKGTAVSASAPTSGQFLVYDGTTNYAPINISGDATMSNVGALTLANSGVTAGTYSKLTVDAKGRVTVGANIASSDVTTALGYTPLNKAGDAMTGALTMNAENEVRFADTDSSNYVGFKAPGTVSANKIWTLPSADGSAGQILKTDGAGNLSWVNDTTGTSPGDASYSVKGLVQLDTDVATSGLNVSSGVVSVNFGTGANQIVKLDGTSKLPAVDGSQLTNLNASNLSSGTLPAARLPALTGDVTSSAGSNSVTLNTVSIAKGGTGQTTQTAAFDALSPLTTKGDLVVHNGTNNVRLAVGSDGKALIADSAQATGVKWGDIYATDLLSLSTTGIVQRNGAGSYSSVTVNSPLTYSAGALGVSVGTAAGTLAAGDDSRITGALQKSGGTMTGAIDMGSQDLTSVGNIAMSASKTLGLSSNAADPGSPSAGQVWYNSTSNTINFYNGSSVKTLGVSDMGLQSFNGATGTTQTMVMTTSGTDVSISRTSNQHEINIPSASATNRGVLTSTDWSSFNNKLGTTLTNGYIWVGNGSNVATAVQMSNDVTLDNAGAATIANSVVTSAKISDGTITGSDISSSAALSVASLTTSGNGSIGGTLTVTSSISAPSYNYTSDRRLKKDIVSMSGLETILRLRGVRFNWIKDGRPEVGLIAQEVEKVVPELVVTDAKTGFKAVKYGNIVSPLIESTKELYGMCATNAQATQKVGRDVASLKTEMDQLKKENEDLRKEIQEIKKMIMEQRK